MKPVYYTIKKDIIVIEPLIYERSTGSPPLWLGHIGCAEDLSAPSRATGYA